MKLTSLLKALVGVGICIATLISSAQADGPYRKSSLKDAPDAYPAQVNWSGIYIGGHLGGAWSDTGYTSTTGVVVDLSQEAQSVIGGGQLGLRYQSGGLVLGAEVSYSGASLDSRDVLFGVERFSSSINGMWLVTGQVGWAWDRSLLYVKGGWASADVDFDIFHVGSGRHASSGGRENGWVIGAGWEYAMGSGWSIGLEYNHIQIDIGDHVMTPGGLGCGPPCSITRADSSIDTVVARLNYTFSGRW